MQNIVLAWLIRRAMEVGGLVGSLLAAWATLPPGTQNAVIGLLTSKWETVTLGALAPIALAVWGYAWSFISTVRPQVVTEAGKQIALPKGSIETTKVEVIAKSAPKPQTLLKRLGGLFTR